MVYDAIVIIALACLEDRYAVAARRALIANAPDTPTRSAIIVKIGQCFVGIGERMEGMRYSPVAPLSPHHSPR